MAKIQAIIIKAYNFIFLYIFKNLGNFLPRTNKIDHFIYNSFIIYYNDFKRNPI